MNQGARTRGRHPGRAASRRKTPHHAIENADIARVFREMGDVLEIEGANAFRIRAYRNAARAVEQSPESIDSIARERPEALTELPGIGEDLAGKITEIVKTGRLRALRAESRKVPARAVELMRVPGIGPKRAKAICDRLGIRSLAGLRRAARAGRLRTIPRLGARAEARILEEIDAVAGEERRTPRPIAAQYVEPLLAYIRALPGVSRAEIAGSYRRCRDTVGDLDLIVEYAHGNAAIEHFVAYPDVRTVLSRGTTKASVRLRSGLQVDLRTFAKESYGAGLFYLTGSKAHNIALRRIAQQRGLKINEYGLFRGTKRIAGRSERELFAALGLPLIPPELRENRGEIEAAQRDALPRLISLEDVRGDLQLHTTDSDGRDTLEAMARAAEERGYEYIAVTDHTPHVRIAGGMTAAGFRRQWRRIDRLNATLKTLTILKGAEVDILADGSLDLDDATLAALDVVLVSMHTQLDLAPEAQTRRVLRALDHRSVDIFAHPTGRLIGKRRGARFDQDAVFRAAVERGICLEVNGQPERLDLDDVAIRGALAHGAMLSFGTDAHGVAELDFMTWGVEQARRGWVEKRHVLNTKPLARVLRLLHAARR